MSQDAFARRHEATWARFDHIVATDRTSTPEEVRAFPALYRRVAAHLALARHRQYRADLVATLNARAMEGYQRLYQGRAATLTELRRFVGVSYPRAVRANAGLVAVAAVVFLAPALAIGVALVQQPELIYSVLDPETVANFEDMYSKKGEHFGRDRDSDSDLLMFGFYIRNNIGISLRTFAGGALAGVGALFFLAYNGLFLGAVTVHLAQAGMGDTLFPYVIGHGAFELTALVLSGATGLKIGLAGLSPGRRSRASALRASALESLPLVYGFSGMLVIAAFLEAFWSSNQALSSSVRLGVGAGLWLAVFAYLGLAGRSRGH